MKTQNRAAVSAIIAAAALLLIAVASGAVVYLTFTSGSSTPIGVGTTPSTTPSTTPAKPLFMFGTKIENATAALYPATVTMTMGVTNIGNVPIVSVGIKYIYVSGFSTPITNTNATLSRAVSASSPLMPGQSVFLHFTFTEPIPESATIYTGATSNSGQTALSEQIYNPSS